MKLIQQSVEEITQTGFDLISIKKHIEKCARISYKSENNITDDSYEKFVNMLENRNHARPLEFGTVYLIFNETKAYKVKKYENNPWSKVKTVIDQDDNTPNIYATVKYYITTNYRVIKENHWEEDFKYICNPTKYHYKRYTIHFITNRAIMDEIRTHVGLSHLAESTRYCNYSKNKFDNELTFIIPPYVDTKVGTDSNSIKWSDTMYSCEQAYLELLKNGWKPQQARDVLPLSIKSELVSCGFEDAWQNFVYRRSDKAAHVMVRELSDSIKEFDWMKTKELCPIFYGVQLN